MARRSCWTQNSRHVFGLGCLVVACLVACLPELVADEGPFDDAAAASDGILVMRNGTVMAGKISQLEDSYHVEGKYGNVQVPASMVKMRCSGIREAYQRLHGLTARLQSADSHVTLAKWCVTNQLEAEAVQELNDALELEPEREDVKRMLRGVTESTKSERKTPPRERDEPVRTPPADVAPAEEGATLGGLDLPLALHYTRRVQPLLVKTCATAGCHNRDSNAGFQLYHVIPGKPSNRFASERNLSAVLEQIDLKNPGDSPLLKKPRGSHGRNGRPLFFGPRGEEQLSELETWVRSVARAATRQGRQTAGGGRKGSIRQVSAAAEDPVARKVRGNDPFATRATVSELPFSGERRERKLSESGRNDPFDPAGFNRQATGGRAPR